MHAVCSRVGLHYQRIFSGDFFLTSSYLRPGTDGAETEHFVDSVRIRGTNRTVNSRGCHEEMEILHGSCDRILLVPAAIAGARDIFQEDLCVELLSQARLVLHC